MRFRLVFAMTVLALSTLAIAEDGKPCCGKNKKKQKDASHVANASEGSYGPPWACPLWIIQNLGPNYNHYHAEYFETCEDDPIVFSMYGNFNLVEECSSECEDGKKWIEKASTYTRYPGLDDYFDVGDNFVFPAGDDRDYARRFTDEDLKFIKFQPDPRLATWRYAKVFAFELDYPARYNNQDLEKETIYIAAELKAPLPEGTPAPPVNCERLEPELVGECHRFRATYRGTGRPRQILLLTPEDSP